MNIVDVGVSVSCILNRFRNVTAARHRPSVRLVRACVTGFALLIGGGCSAEQSGDGAANPTSCPEHQRYRQGMRAGTESGASVAIVSAEPSPPAAGLNEWRIEITDNSGVPVSDASVIATTWMPAHSHPAPEPVVTSLGSGTYDLSAVNFIMPGLWQVTIGVQSSAHEMDRALFELCVEG